MGGLIIWVTAAVVITIYGLLMGTFFFRNQIVLPLFILITTGILGAVDDILNMKGRGRIKGLGIRSKFFWQIVIAGLGAWWFFDKLGFNTLHVPAVGDFSMGAWYILFFMVVVIATANAVNITDGLDGLAGGLLGLSFGAYSVIAYLQGNFGIAAFCTVIVGALIAFLWFNINPARFFMGDTGAFALGSTLAVVALLTDSALVLIVIGLVFVAEAGSSLIQRFSKKIFKRKIFISAPFHHHLQAIGWSETKIVMRLWLLGMVFAIVGLAIGILGMGVK